MKRLSSFGFTLLSQAQSSQEPVEKRARPGQSVSDPSESSHSHYGRGFIYFVGVVLKIRRALRADINQKPPLINPGYAPANDVHLLCLPAHCTHILQPLDVGIFKPFKSYFSKACTAYLAHNPGCVITPEKLSSLVAEAWPKAFTPVNILAGFKKSGIHPLNPGEITDRQVGPAKTFQYPPCDNKEVKSSEAESLESSSDALFSPEKVALFKTRFEENYDLNDPEYVAWLKIFHPEVDVSAGLSDASSLSSEKPYSHSSVKSSDVSSEAADVLSSILVLPKAPAKSKSKRKPALTKYTVCITDTEVLEQLKEKEKEKMEIEEAKIAKQQEMERRKQEREEKKRQREEKKQEREEKRRQKEASRGLKRKEEVKKIVQKKKQEKSGRLGELESLFTGLTISSDESDKDEEEDEAVCPKCGMLYSADSGLWVCCDNCDRWYNLKCTNIKSKRTVPEVYICDACV